MRKFVFAILMGLLLASCEQRPARGYVVGKEYVAAHNVVFRDVATNTLQTRHIADQWIVWLADSCSVRSYNVDEATFGNVRHGEFIRIKCK